jgi:hypothetical protein
MSRFPNDDGTWLALGAAALVTAVGAVRSGSRNLDGRRKKIAKALTQTTLESMGQDELGSIEAALQSVGSLSRKPVIRVPVRHARFGEGYGERFAESIDGTPLLFIRWTGDSGGVAGGWYDPMDEKLTIESARLLSDLYARDIGVSQE